MDSMEEEERGSPPKPQPITKNNVVFKLAGNNRTAKVFEFFLVHEKEVSVPAQVICLICKKTLKGISPTNMKSHLSNKHDSSAFLLLKQ
jgi:hypothetical protein